MVPVSGSAYTYSYAVLGELLAWMVGWALILEYAVAAGAVVGRLVRVRRWACSNSVGRHRRCPTRPCDRVPVRTAASSTCSRS